MTCVNCSHDNTSDAKFCAACGAALAVLCPSCDAGQQPGSKFCNQCGSPLSEPADHARAVSGTPAVRKNVTALFGDLVGSTSFGEQVDPETARAAMADYFELVRSTIEDHAGTVVKFMGDGVMAIFGIPEIAEDDAVRAVTAAGELQQRFRSFADMVRERYGVELGLRVGVNTGELVIGDHDADLVGDVLNTAARLEAACRPSCVLVGEDTWRLTRSSIVYEVLGEIRVKGKAAPIATFQVVDAASRSPDELTPFVGRSTELAALRDVFTEAHDSGAARLATVIGAPGVGKTRLAAELCAGTTSRSFDLRFERSGSTTFTPIADLLRELTGTGSVHDIERLVAGHPEAERLTGVLCSLLGHGETRSTEESFWAIRRLLEFLGAEDPLTVVFDDIQWAEPLFWDLLDHLVEWADAPVLLLALARPELRELRPDLAQVGRRVSATIALEGLDAAATRELAARLLDADELPDELIERLPDSTEGNPLFVRELVHMLVDDGVVERAGDRWRLTIDADAIEVPPTILSLLASRVERLPDDERHVVELASVIGTEFDRGVLSAIARADVAARLGAVMERLRRKDLIEPAGAWAGDHPVYRFHHVLIRDAAYRRLLKARRADLHEEIGHHLASVAASDELDVTIAHHYESAHAYRSDLGIVDHDTAVLAAEAARRLQSAAVSALAQEDLAASGTSALRALALVGDGDDRDELLTLGCEALLSSGDVSGGGPLVDELVERSSDPRLAAWADCFRAQLWSLTDSERLVDAAGLADAAAGRLADLGDDAGVAKARLVRASTLARLGQVGDCEAELDLALAAARAAGDRRRTIAVLGAAPLAALWGPSPVARAGGRCLDVLRLLRITTASPAVEATSIRCQGMLEALRGRFDSAREKFETSRSTARDLGLRHGLYETELFAGFVELLAGDPAAAEPHLRLARHGLGVLGIGADSGQAGALLARSLLLQDRIDEADQLATAAVASAGQNLRTGIASKAVLGEIRAAQGRLGEARELVDDAVATAEGTDVVLDHALSLLAAERVAMAGADHDGARELAARAGNLLDVKGASIADPEHRRPSTVAHRSSSEHVDEDVTGPDLENRAVRAGHRLRVALVAGRREQIRAVLADDFVNASHERTRRALGAQPLGPDDYVDAVLQLDDLADEMSARSSGSQPAGAETKAIRGDDLALAAVTLEIGDTEHSLYVITETRGDLICALAWFDETQFGEALDELDRRWVELGGPAPTIELNSKLRAAFASGNPELVRACLAPDLVVADHRTIGDGPVDADTWVRSMEGVTLTGEAATQLHSQVILGWTGTVTWAVLAFGHDRSDWGVHSITVGDGDRYSVIELFDLDQVDVARNRFHDLTAAHGSESAPANNAWSTFVDFEAAIRAGDAAGARSWLSLGYDYGWHDPLRPTDRTATTDQHVAALIASTDAAGSNTGPVLVATRGEELVLGRGEVGDESASAATYFVVRVRDGLIERTDWFGSDQPVPAYEELDRQWVELGGRVDHVLDAIGRALSNGPFDAYASLFGPAFEVVDHRELGVGRRDRQEWLESTEQIVGNVTVPGIVEYLGVDDASALVRTRMTSKSDGSSWDLYLLHEHDGRRATRWEEFPISARVEAIARFRQLTHRASRAPSAEFGNRAWDVSQRFRDAFESGDVGLQRDLLHAHFASHLRMSLLGVAETLDADAHLDQTAAIAASSGSAQITLLATRGDDLALSRVVTGPDDAVSERLLVLRTESGLVIRLVWFDETQLLQAMDELDRQWVESGGPAGIAESIRRWRNIFDHGTIDELRSMMASDFSVVDHRSIGLGERSGDDWIETVTEFVGSATINPVAYFDTAVDACLIRGTFALHDSDDVLIDGPAIIRFTDDGRIRSIELFDQLDEARRRFAEIAERSVAHEVSNAASRTMERFAVAVNDGDVDRFVAMMHTEYVHDLHQRLRVAERMTRGDAIELTRTMIAGNAHLACETIAVRGEDLAVGRLVSAFEDDHVTLIYLLELHDGLIHRAATFDTDRFHDALDELDRLWVERGGPADFCEALGRFRHVVAHGTVGELRDVIADDFVAVDHRPLGLGTRTREAWIESIGEFVGGATTVIITSEMGADRVHLYRGTFALGDGTVLVDGPAVMTLDDRRRLTRMELFDHDQSDDARHRFEELVDKERAADVETNERNGRSSQNEPGLTNAATRLGDDLAAAYESGDEERLRRVISADFTWRLRTTFATAVDAPERDRDSYLDGVLSRIEARTVPPRLEHEVLAVRGDELFLARSLMRDGDDETDRLAIGQSADGQLVHLIHYDAHQLDEAMDDLDRLFATAGGPSRLLEAQRRYGRALGAGDVDAAREVLSTSLLIRDHRPLAIFDDVDRDGYLESTVRHARGARMIVLEIADHTDDVALERVKFTASDQSTWGAQWSVVCLDEQGIACIDIYDVDDFDAAQTRYRAATSDPASPVAGPHRSEAQQLTNSAWEMLQRCQSLYGKPEFASLLAEHFESRVHETLRTHDTPMSRREFVEQMVEIARWNESVSSSVELVAVRGSELCLAINTLRNGPDERIALALVRSDDVEVSSVDWYDEHQRNEALDELDRQWVETGGSTQIADVWSRFRTAITSGDEAGVRNCVTDDFVDVDHRTLGTGERSMVDECVATMPTSNADETFSLAVGEFARWSDNCALSRVRRVSTSSGSASDFWAVSMYRDGRLSRNEVFPIDRYAAAVDRYEELRVAGAPGADAHGSRPSPANRAWDGDDELPSNAAVRIVDEVLEACERVDRTALEALIHDEFVSSRRERRYLALGVRDVDKQGYIDEVVDAATWAGARNSVVTDRRPLVTAGADLYLSRGQLRFGDDVIDDLAVTECRDGRLAALTWFDLDDLGEALDELDRRWLDRGGPNRLIGWGRALRQVLSSGSPTDLADLTADELVVIDHRLLGFDERGREEWLESMAPLVGDWDSFATVLEHTESTWLAAGRMQRRSDGALAVDGLLIQQIDADDRLMLMELYDRHDLTEARRRFDELAHTAPNVDRTNAQADGAEHRGELPTAFRLANLVAAAFGRADPDLADAVLAIDFEMSSGSPLRVDRPVGRTDFIALLTDELTNPPGPRAEQTMLQARGDELCLIHVVEPAGVEFLCIVEARADRLQRIIRFDLDQREEAGEELERLHAERIDLDDPAPTKPARVDGQAGRDDQRPPAGS